MIGEFFSRFKPGKKKEGSAGEPSSKAETPSSKEAPLISLQYVDSGTTNPKHGWIIASKSEDVQKALADFQDPRHHVAEVFVNYPGTSAEQTNIVWSKHIKSEWKPKLIELIRMLPGITNPHFQ